MDDKLPVLTPVAKLCDTASVCSPRKVVEFAKKYLQLDVLAEEYGYILAVDTKNNIIGVFNTSHGTVNTTYMNPREIFIRLLLCGAVAYFALHNHPSGDPQPSEDDDKATKKLIHTGHIIGIELLDHIIIGDTYYSYRENAKI